MIYKVALTCVCKYRGGCLQALILANVLPASLGIHTEQVFHSWSTGDFCLMELNLSLLRYWALRVSTIGRGDIEPSQETTSNETIGSMSPNPSSSHFISSHFIYVHLSSSRVITVHKWQHHGSEHSGREKRRWEQKTARVRGTPTQELEHQPNFGKKTTHRKEKHHSGNRKHPYPPKSCKFHGSYILYTSIYYVTMFDSCLEKKGGKIGGCSSAILFHGWTKWRKDRSISGFTYFSLTILWICRIEIQTNSDQTRRKE